MDARWDGPIGDCDDEEALMSQAMKNQELSVLAELTRRMANGSITAAQVQALIEKQPVGRSSLDDKLVANANVKGVKATEAFMRQTMTLLDGTELKRHHNGGGWVPVEQDMNDPEMPYVSGHIFVGMRAVVSGPAKIYGGEFHDGYFGNGFFYGGMFHGGRYKGGIYHGGVFLDGYYEAGVYFGGTFHDGEFYGGKFASGTFLKGKYLNQDADYMTSGKTYHSDADADNISSLMPPSGLA